MNQLNQISPDIADNTELMREIILASHALFCASMEDGHTDEVIEASNALNDFRATGNNKNIYEKFVLNIDYNCHHYATTNWSDKSDGSKFDIQCNFCGQWNEDLGSQWPDDYIDDEADFSEASDIFPKVDFSWMNIRSTK
jgi:hypothetical protein